MAPTISAHPPIPVLKTRRIRILPLLAIAIAGMASASPVATLPSRSAVSQSAVKAGSSVSAAGSAQQGRVGELQRSIAAHPDSVTYYLQLARVQQERRALKSAVPTLKGGLIYIPYNARLRKALAEAYADDKQYLKAIEQYQWYLQLCDSTERSAGQDSIARLSRLQNPGRPAARPGAVKSSATPARSRVAPSPAPVPASASAAPAKKSAVVPEKADSINTAALPEVEFRIDSLLSLVAIDTLRSAGQQMLLGIHEFLVEQYDAALREFKKGAATYPTAPLGAQCLYNAGVCYCRLHLFPEAENQFGQLLSRFPRDTLAGRALFMKAFTYAQRRNHEAAEKICREFLSSCPHHPWSGRAWIMLGNSRLESGRPGDAVDAFRQALAGKMGCPERALAWMKMGDGCRGVGDPTRAQLSYDSAVVIGGRCGAECLAAALYKLGDERYRTRNYPGALDCYRRATYQFPGFAETPWGLFQTGNALRNMGNYHEAIGTYKNLVARFPGSYWAGQAKWKLEDTVWESEYVTKK